MNNLGEYEVIIDSISYLIFAVLILFLAFRIKNISGKGWLKAYAVITLLELIIFRILHITAQYSPESRAQIYQWYDVIFLLGPFMQICLLMFLFANWCTNRMNVKPYNLLFSYQGRIPRAAFWIAVFSVFPIGLKIGWAPLVNSEAGPVKIALWIIYALWIIPAFWIHLAIYTKRWHDLGKSGWMSLVSLIPVIGALYLIWQLGFIKGTSGTNAYGKDPLEVSQAELTQ
jgi:uncharacterized membrane protein YhaH (DUF805 family)